MSRRPAYAVSWQFASDRRCAQCGRFCSEAQTAAQDFRHNLRWCERCVIGRELRLVARVGDVAAEERRAA